MNMLYDIAVSFIGAFLGFAFALLSETIVSIFVKNRDLKCYVSNMKQELNNIYEVLLEYKDSSDISLFFDIPIWEAFVQSGGIRYLLRKSYYIELLNVYSKIKKTNELEINDQSNDDDERIIAKRNEVFESLQKLFQNEDFASTK